jgi:cellulose synthase/poly-beta-1,6-N-acetylglucosamine synthase-like glycosyltransferase
MRETIAQAQYLGWRVLVIDDGSTPGFHTDELSNLCREMSANLVRHAHNRGKAAALATGLAAIDADVIVTVDADTVLTARDLAICLEAFREPRLGALTVTIAAASGGHLESLQAVEYRYLLDFERQTLASLGQVFTVPGAASFWRREALTEAGGFSGRTLAEDTDATIGIRRAGWRVAALREASATTCVPASLLQLLHQRSRWIWGNIQVAVRHAATIRGSNGACWPATSFAALTIWHVSTYLLGVWTLWVIAFDNFSIAAIAVTFVLAVLGVVRLALAVHSVGGRLDLLPRLLPAVFLMQVLNTVAFWGGLISAQVFRQRWVGVESEAFCNTSRRFSFKANDVSITKSRRAGQ